jgi:Na+-translocating ferredoxin:NAD+ oxidoreductase RnfA subunit
MSRSVAAGPNRRRAAVGRGVVALVVAVGNALIAVMLLTVGPFSGDGGWALAVLGGSAAAVVLVALPVAALNFASTRSARPDGLRSGAADLMAILAVGVLVVSVTLLLVRDRSADLTTVGVLFPMVTNCAVLCFAALSTRAGLRLQEGPPR